MAFNTDLKMAIFRSGLTQTEIAKRTGIYESRLSRIVRGHQDANDDEKRVLAKALKVKTDQLFAERVA